MPAKSGQRLCLAINFTCIISLPSKKMAIKGSLLRNQTSHGHAHPHNSTISNSRLIFINVSSHKFLSI